MAGARVVGKVSENAERKKKVLNHEVQATIQKLQREMTKQNRMEEGGKR